MLVVIGVFPMTHCVKCVEVEESLPVVGPR